MSEKYDSRFAPFPLTSSSFSERRRQRHWKTHHSCYYRPSCVRCWLRAYLEVLIIFVKINPRSKALR